MKTFTIFRTDNASRYLQQLCKHFQHKTEVVFTATEGRCVFDVATAQMIAGDDLLKVTIEAEDAAALERGQNVIWKHLERFAFRESLPAPYWQMV